MRAPVMQNVIRNSWNRFADPYETSTLSARARRRRWSTLLNRFPDLADMSVVDLGGDIRSWKGSPVRPASLLLINTVEQEVPEWAEAMVADACDLPDSVRSRRFDLVYSNSVIEHVGGHVRRSMFASTASSLGDRLWIQTPYRYFPLEPHWLFPGFQFLPVAARARLMQRVPLGSYPAGLKAAEAVGQVLDVELLSATEMRFYFPDAELWHERFAGLTKSIVAIR